MDTGRTVAPRTRKVTPLKRALFDRQMTQADLARTIGMDQGFLSHIVNGRHPNDSHASLIANALGLPAAELWPAEDVDDAA
jgi:transcriptional regulator with XRE-family HTH domain